MDIAEKILWIPLLTILSAFAGPWLFFAYPDFTVWQKVAYGLFLLLCIGVFVFGFRLRQKPIGKILIALALVGWCLAGLVGMGTTD